MKPVVTSILLLGFVLAVPRCGGEIQSQNGSESHFLGDCRESSDCAQGLACVCGVCTARCGAESDCAPLSPVAVCADPDGLVAGCDESEDVCQIACATQGDCGSTELGCSEGTCRRNDEPGDGGSGKGGMGASSGGGSSGNGGAGGAAAGTGGDGGVAQSDAGGAGGEAGGVSDAGTVVAPPPSCDADAGACFCESFAACRQDELTESLPLGGRGYRVCGTAGDGCAVSYFSETEGGVSIYRCYADRDATCTGDPWSSLSAMPCDLVASCNALLGDCPADVLDCTAPDPAPTCAAIDPGVDACCAGYAVSNLTGVCTCVCPMTQVPLYDSVESCEAACGSPALTCAAVDPASFGDCTLSLGYGFDGTGCIGISGCGTGAEEGLFASRDECWQGCARSCDDVEARRSELLADARQCQVDDDCMWVESSGPTYDHCSCLVAVNRNIDVGAWRNLNFAYGCYEQNGCCDAVPPNTACIDGQCAAGPF